MDFCRFWGTKSYGIGIWVARHSAMHLSVQTARHPPNHCQSDSQPSRCQAHRILFPQTRKIRKKSLNSLYFDAFYKFFTFFLFSIKTSRKKLLKCFQLQWFLCLFTAFSGFGEQNPMGLASGWLDIQLSIYLSIQTASHPSSHGQSDSQPSRCQSHRSCSPQPGRAEQNHKKLLNQYQLHHPLYCMQYDILHTRCNVIICIYISMHAYSSFLQLFASCLITNACIHCGAWGHNPWFHKTVKRPSHVHGGSQD